MAIKTRQNPDGSVTTEMSLGADTELRPVRDDVVEAFDAALSKLGGPGAQVMHAMDPSRLVDFPGGGPPVWSVGMVPIAGPVPYTLYVTYGFSHALSPADYRDGIAHEYSLAIAGDPQARWGDAFLRYVARYVLSNQSDVRVGDIVPLLDHANDRAPIPMTRAPFPPHFHAQLPNSTLVGYLCAPDPVLPTIRTAHGSVEVRRIVGIDQRELDRAETWDAHGFLAAFLGVNPLLLSTATRPSAMDDAAFRARCEAAFDRDGSSVDALLVRLDWDLLDSDDEREHIALDFPTAPRDRERLCNALLGRVARHRRLVMFTTDGSVLEIVTDPEAEEASFEIDDGGHGLLVFPTESEERAELIAAARTEDSFELVI